VAFLILLLLPGIVLAQETTAENGNPTENTNEKKAFELLDTVASKITSLKSPDNRIAISCGVAELMWKKDEKRARTLFENAMKEMSDMIANIDLTDPQLYSTLSSINQLRQDVAGRIARCDPELALTFLRSTRIETGVPYNNSYERSVELYLSRVIAAKNPELAAKVARESLKQGLSYDYISLLLDLQRKNSSLTESLYADIVDRIKEEDLARSTEAINVACNLVNSFQPPAANEATFRDLLETMVKAALSLSPVDPVTASQARTIQQNFQNSISLVEKYLPGRAPAMKQWSQRIMRTQDPGTIMYSEINEISQKGTVDDVLALAQKYPAENRFSIYQQAAWKASSQGDDARARQIINDFITDPVQRKQMTDQIDNSILGKAVNENKVAEARALLTKSMSIEQRFQALLQIANQLSSKDDKKTAIACLDDARVLAASAPKNSQKMWMQLQLASSYSELDVNQSFSLIEGIMDQLNELVAAAVVMDGFENQYLKNGEWMINGPSGLGNTVNNMRRTLSMMGRKEFGRAEVLSDRLERPEIRLMTQLDLAQAILSSEANTSSRRYMRYSKR
jgi:hypothetical protein